MVPNSKLDQFFEEVDENRDVCMPFLLVSCIAPLLTSLLLTVPQGYISFDEWR